MRGGTVHRYADWRLSLGICPRDLQRGRGACHQLNDQLAMSLRGSKAETYVDVEHGVDRGWRLVKPHLSTAKLCNRMIGQLVDSEVF